MIAGTLNLPQGRRGQVLALALTALAAAILWLVLAAPLLGWFEARADLLTQQREIAARMAALSQDISAQRAAMGHAGQNSVDGRLLLAGATDAIAGANLQSALQDLATQAGTNLDSSSLLPAQQADALRRIGLQVSVTATWPVLMALLQAIDTADPRMMIDGLSVTNVSQPGADQPTVQASFSVNAFRAGTTP